MDSFPPFNGFVHSRCPEGNTFYVNPGVRAEHDRETQSGSHAGKSGARDFAASVIRLRGKRCRRILGSPENTLQWFEP